MNQDTQEEKIRESFNWSSFWCSLGWITAFISVILLVGVSIWFMFWVTFVDNYEFGYTYDKLTGKVTPIEHTGWVVATPLRYKVHTIDTRAYQVKITASPNLGERILNAKLVCFNHEGLETLLKWHGRGAGQNLNEWLEIMKCYAFDVEEGRDCPFITIKKVLSPSQTGEPAK